MKQNIFQYSGYILILLIILIISVDAFTLDESIKIADTNTNANDSSSGLLYSRTDSSGLKGMVVGVGNQVYHEHLDTDAGNSIYSTSYNLSSELSNPAAQNLSQPFDVGGKNGTTDYLESNTNSIRFNRYSVRMDSLNGLSHFLNLRTNSNIQTTNAIVHNAGTKTVTTSYILKTNGGSIEEGVVALDDRHRPKYVIERNIIGAAEIKSNFSDSESRQAVSDRGLMLEKLESINMAGETGHIQFIIPTNNILIENSAGDLNFNVSNGSAATAGIGLPKGGINVSINEDVLSNVKDQTTPSAQAALEEVPIVSRVVVVNKTTFIIPIDNIADNPLQNETNSSNLSAGNDHNTPQIPAAVQADNSVYNPSNGTDLSNSSANLSANSSTDANIVLSIMSAEDSPSLAQNACPYLGSCADCSNASDSKNYSENSYPENNSAIQSANLSNSASEQEPGENRTVEVGKVTFLIGDSDLPPPKQCVRQYVGLRSVELGPPCTVKIGRGMGGGDS